MDHPYLVVHSNTAPPSGNPAPEEQGACALCRDPLEDAVVAGCHHAFCRACIAEFLENTEGACVSTENGVWATIGKCLYAHCDAFIFPPNSMSYCGYVCLCALQRAMMLCDIKCISATYRTTTGAAVACPTCAKPLSVDLAAPSAAPSTAPRPTRGHRSILHRIDLSRFQTSTKIEALREELAAMKQRDPSAKCICFSQFTSMLDLIYYRLTQCGWQCVRLCGSMSMDQRNAVIDRFTNDPDVTVFLMSLKAGGVALNLTAASHVMLMDPWYDMTGSYYGVCHGFSSVCVFVQTTVL